MLVIDRPLLLESKWRQGVWGVSLSRYVNDWNDSGRPYSGNLLIACHFALDDSSNDALTLFASKLVTILGRPYMLRNVLRMGLRELAVLIGVRFRRLQPKKTIVCSEYIFQAYTRRGIHIPWNAQGSILPSDIAAHPKVSLLCRLR